MQPRSTSRFGFDFALASLLESELDEELDRGGEVVYDDADLFQSF
jgi:hypothetical protein